MEAANDVFPVPGGPTNNSIRPFVVYESEETAMNSRILSLISSIP